MRIFTRTRLAALAALLAVGSIHAGVEARAANASSPYHLLSNPSSPAFIFGGQPVIPRPPFRITIHVDGTVTAVRGLGQMQPRIKFHTSSLLRIAVADGFFKLPKVISGSHPNVDNGPVYITVVTTSGRKKVTLSPTGTSPGFSDLYRVLNDVVSANMTCSKPRSCAPTGQ